MRSIFTTSVLVSLAVNAHSSSETIFNANNKNAFWVSSNIWRNSKHNESQAPNEDRKIDVTPRGNFISNIYVNISTEYESVREPRLL